MRTGIGCARTISEKLFVKSVKVAVYANTIYRGTGAKFAEDKQDVCTASRRVDAYHAKAQEYVNIKDTGTDVLCALRHDINKFTTSVPKHPFVQICAKSKI